MVRSDCNELVIVMNLFDMHTHFSTKDEWKIRKENRIFSCFSGGTPEECAFLLEQISLPDFQNLHTHKKSSKKLSHYLPQDLYSFGLHPWHAEEHERAEIVPYLEKATISGEIGMACADGKKFARISSVIDKLMK